MLKAPKRDDDVSIVPFFLIATFIIFAGYYMIFADYSVNLQDNKITGFQIAGSITNPVPMQLGSPVSGNVSGLLYYTFTTSVGKKYNVNTESLTYGTIIQIWGCGYQSTITSTGNSEYNTNDPASGGRCWVTVNSQLGNGDYKFTVTDITPQTPIEGTTEDKAIVLQLGNTISGTVPSYIEGIYYKFSGAIGKNYVIDLTGTHAVVSGCEMYPKGIRSSVVLGSIMGCNRAVFSCYSSSSPCIITVFGPGSYSFKVTETEMPVVQGSYSSQQGGCDLPQVKFYADTSKKYWISSNFVIGNLYNPNMERIGSLPLMAFTPTTSGYHYISVWEENGGTLSITIREEAAITKNKIGDPCTKDEECESNYCDSFLKTCYLREKIKYPGRLAAGTTTTGSLNAGEISFYEFYPIANQQYLMTFGLSAGRSEFCLLDKNKAPLTTTEGTYGCTGNSAGNPDIKLQVKPPTSDLIYVALRPDSRDSTISYSISPAAVQALIRDISVTPADITFSNYNPVDKTVDVSIKVYNKGNLDAYVTLNVNVTSKQGTTKLNEQYYSITSGNSHTFTLKQAVSEGANKFSAKVHMQGVTNLGLEANTADNYAEKTYAAPATIATQPDFIISDFSSSIPSTQDSVTLFATIKNTGTTDVSNLKVDFFYIKSDASCCISNVAPTQYISLKAGESKTVSASMEIPQGQWKFKVWLDLGNAILESNENNNFAEKFETIGKIQQACGNNVCETNLGETFQSCSYDCRCGNTVCDSGETYKTCPADCKQALPDLAVINFYTSNANPVEDDLLTIYATVKNYGDANTNNFGTYLTYKQDDGLTNEIDTKYISLNAGESKTVSSSLYVVKGTYVLGVFVDSGKTITELNENNNLAQKTLIVAQRQAEAAEVCGDGVCRLPENCETCPQDCLTEGIEICCDKLRTIGNCCSDTDCKAGEHCSASTCVPIEKQPEAQLICGDNLCSFPDENCANCQADCLFEDEVCCGKIRVMGDCCTDTNCKSDAKCTNNVCSMHCNNNRACDASEKPEDCGDCIYTVYLDLANPYELFRSTELPTFIGFELIEGVQENNWPAQAEFWASESTNSINTAENLGVLGKIYEGLKLVKKIVELPKALKDMAQALVNLKGVSGASGIASHLDDFKKVAEGIKGAESASQDIGVDINDEDIIMADNSGKLIDIAISLRDKTSPEASDVLGITDITDLLFSGKLASAQADYYWQEATVAATLSAYAYNLDKLSAKQANGIMSRKDFSRYMMNLYAYSRSNELYYATKYAKNNAYSQTISGKAMTLSYCYFTNIDILDCYNSFQEKVVEAEKGDSEKWGSAASHVKALAEKYNVRVE